MQARLTSEESLVALQVGHLTLNDTTIGRHNVTVGQEDDIARYDVFDRDDLGDRIAFAVGMTNDGGLRRSDRFERGDSLSS